VVSRRTYGNAMIGTPDTVKQLWIGAIDLDAPPGADPSHPAFWLPEQDPAANATNQRPRWAMSPSLDGASAR